MRKNVFTRSIKILIITLLLLAAFFPEGALPEADGACHYPLDCRDRRNVPSPEGRKTGKETRHPPYPSYPHKADSQDKGACRKNGMGGTGNRTVLPCKACP